MTGEQVMMILLTTTADPMSEEDARAALAKLPAHVLDRAARDKEAAISLTRYVKAGMPVVVKPV